MRRLLLDGGAPRSHNEYNRAANFDTNMVIILAALLCALICALGINSIVRCILRCATRMSPPEAADQTAPRKGLRKAALLHIPVAVYGSGQRAGTTECAICLGEFSERDKIRVLPTCHHCFHVKCVDVWLGSHSSCPTCRHSLLDPGDGEVVGEGGGRLQGSADTPASASAAEDVA